MSYIKIKNTALLAKSIRKNAAMVFPASYYNNADSLISIGQIEKLINEYCETSDMNETFLSDENYSIIFETVQARLYNSSLSNIASRGEIECAWDEDINEMVFWHPKSNTTFNIVRQ